MKYTYSEESILILLILVFYLQLLDLIEMHPVSYVQFLKTTLNFVVQYNFTAKGKCYILFTVLLAAGKCLQHCHGLRLIADFFFLFIIVFAVFYLFCFHLVKHESTGPSKYVGG